MDDGIVSDCHAGSNMNRKIRVRVDGGIVLHIAVVSDCDGIGVPAHDGIVPDSYICPCPDIADDVCPRGGKPVLTHDIILLICGYGWRDTHGRFHLSWYMLSVQLLNTLS
jgi:hypothetical protein